MATTVADLTSVETMRTAMRPRGRRRAAMLLMVSVLTLVAIGVHGYHPYAEDGGLYMAGVTYRLDPTLYRQSAGFVAGHQRFSVFAPLVAEMARLLSWALGTGVMRSLPAVLLMVHAASIWATLWAMGLLAGRCYASVEARMGAVALLACWLDLPVAGTSLLLMDPYVTARSLATPCVLLALVGALDLTARGGLADVRRRGAAWCAAALVAAAAMHPLMGAYALCGVVVLVCVRAERRAVRVGGIAAMFVGAVCVAFAVGLVAPAETAATRSAAMTRAYWFLAMWRWYEVFGLAAPLAILGGAAWDWRRRGMSAARAVALTAVVCGALAWMVAELFARPGAASLEVARLQPLRLFQMVYVVMVLALGGWLGERVLRRSPVRWLAAMALLGSPPFVAARLTYRASSHLEMLSSTPRNAWVRAFVWIRENTPGDALFALDTDYITLPGEDAQGFRAVAERSAVPDYSKDGGEASVTPKLAEGWVAGQAALRGLSTESDAEREAKLGPVGVSWVVLARGARTGLECPYRNEAVMVCRLR